MTRQLPKSEAKSICFDFLLVFFNLQLIKLMSVALFYGLDRWCKCFLDISDIFLIHFLCVLSHTVTKTSVKNRPRQIIPGDIHEVQSRVAGPL